MSILLRPSGPASWPFVILHPLTHPPHIPLYKQASPTWIAISEKLSPVSWKISPSRKMGHCGSRVLWKVQVLFKSGKMFLLHMMEGKQASLVKTGIHLFHGREPVWYLALWGPPMILPSGIHTLVYSPLTLYSVGLCDQWYMTEWWCVTSRLDYKIQWLLSWLLSCVLALWLGSLALGKPATMSQGDSSSLKEKSTRRRTEFWWQSLEWAWKRIFQPQSSLEMAAAPTDSLTVS